MMIPSFSFRSFHHRSSGVGSVNPTLTRTYPIAVQHEVDDATVGGALADSWQEHPMWTLKTFEERPICWTNNQKKSNNDSLSSEDNWICVGSVLVWNRNPRLSLESRFGPWVSLARPSSLGPRCMWRSCRSSRWVLLNWWGLLCHQHRTSLSSQIIILYLNFESCKTKKKFSVNTYIPLNLKLLQKLRANQTALRPALRSDIDHN